MNAPLLVLSDVMPQRQQHGIQVVLSRRQKCKYRSICKQNCCCSSKYFIIVPGSGTRKAERDSPLEYEDC